MTKKIISYGVINSEMVQKGAVNGRCGFVDLSLTLCKPSAPLWGSTEYCVCYGFEGQY